jgi:MSHA biogenesis protein MshI
MKSYFKWMTHWQTLFARNNAKTLVTNEISCIDFSSDSFSVGYGKKDNGKINLILCETYSYSSNDDLQTSLATIVKYHKLDTVNCTWILQPDQYQLLLIDALPVPANEFQAAVRWKIKDLIRFPFEDIIVDSFNLPITKPSNGQAMTMLVIAKQSELKLMSEQFQEAGLNINKISIPEISLKNISALFDQEDQSTSLIYMQNKNSQLVITNKHLLHFNRRIELGLDFLTPSQDSSVPDAEVAEKMDRFALEIQRSFDYYQSQWRQPLPAKIIFSSAKKLLIDIAPLLSQRLSIPVEILNIDTHFTNKKVISQEDQGKHLLILGSLFDYEGEDNAAKH